MSNADWDFKKRCKEATQDAWDELVENIRNGNPDRYPSDRLFEVADGLVPHLTCERWELVEYLDELWNEAKADNSLDSALGYAIYMKASDYCNEKFYELGGEEKLAKLEEIMDAVNMSLEECDIVTYEQLCDEFADELEELGVATKLPQPKKELKP